MREGMISTKEIMKTGSGVSTSSRYYYQETIQDSQHERLYDLMTTPMGTEYAADSYHVVQTEEVNRLDKIAYAEYGKASLWWLIAWANRIIDPFLIVKGSTLYIPTLAEYGKAARGQ